MTSATVLCAQLHRLVIPDIIRVEEHEADGSSTLMDLEGMSRQDNSLGNNASRVSVHQSSSGDKNWGYNIMNRQHYIWLALFRCCWRAAGRSRLEQNNKLRKYLHTIDILGVFCENDRQVSKLDGSIHSNDSAATMLKETLALVNIVGTLAVARVL